LIWAGAAAFLFVGRVPLPGLDPAAVIKYFAGHPSPLIQLYELVFRGGLIYGGALAVGVMPYLTARICAWIFRSRSRRLTRSLTAVLAVAQSVGYATFLRKIPGAVTSPNTFMATTIVTLTAASLITMWFGEKVTERDEPAWDASDLLERPSVVPALSEPAQPASPLPHPHLSSDPETVRRQR
jgi:preprotein translocase subunit SecY